MIGRRSLFCVFVLLTIWSPQGYGQWNVIAGYDISNLRNTGMNRIIDEYNAGHPERSLAIKRVNILHGFVAGFRYGYEWGGMELAFIKRTTRRIGDDYDVALMDGAFERSNIDLNYDIKTIALTKEFGGDIRLGGSLDYNIYTYSVKYSSREDLRDFRSHQHTWGGKVFLGAHLTNSTRMSFSVRAYYQWIWSMNNLSNFEDRLDVTRTDCTSCHEKPYSVGISIIINNGLQPY